MNKIDARSRARRYRPVSMIWLAADEFVGSRRLDLTIKLTIEYREPELLSPYANDSSLLI